MAAGATACYLGGEIDATAPIDPGGPKLYGCVDARCARFTFFNPLLPGVQSGMARNQQPISLYMSHTPVCVPLDLELIAAVELMARQSIRHLPVLDGEKVVGVVTERDLTVAQSLLPKDWKRFPVAEAMTPDPYCVGADTPLCEVAQMMAEHKYGCALVLDPGGKIIGLFSTVDALRVLAGDLG
ncbi:MAG TPA: CBS domain-containing protein [Polyangiales bacterium]|nr:CBS domain-containing protein [Polyangiales bacterium]